MSADENLGFTNLRAWSEMLSGKSECVCVHARVRAHACWHSRAGMRLTLGRLQALCHRDPLPGCESSTG